MDYRCALLFSCYLFVCLRVYPVYTHTIQCQKWNTEPNFQNIYIYARTYHQCPYSQNRRSNVPQKHRFLWISISMYQYPIPSTGWWSCSPRNSNKLGYSSFQTHPTIIWCWLVLSFCLIMSHSFPFYPHYCHHIHTKYTTFVVLDGQIQSITIFDVPIPVNFSKPLFFLDTSHAITVFNCVKSPTFLQLRPTQKTSSRWQLLHLAGDDDATGQAAIVGLSLGKLSHSYPDLYMV